MSIAERVDRREQLRAPLLVGAGGLAALALLRLRDPHGLGSYGYCPSQYLLGVPCPGCGGLRAVNDVTHGQIVAAVSSNVLAVAILVGGAAVWAAWLVRRWRGQDGPMLRVTPAFGWAVLAAFVVFGVVRNLPFGAWLAP